MPPIIFLDFDDVICLNAPYGGYDVCAPDPPEDLWSKLFHPPAVAVLRVLVDEFDPRFVLTTSWLRLLDRSGFDGLLSTLDKQARYVVAKLDEDAVWITKCG